MFRLSSYSLGLIWVSLVGECRAETLSLRKALDLATQRSPDVGIARTEAESASASVTLAYSDFWPKVYAIGTYRLSRTGTEDSSNGVTSETTYNFSRSSSYDIAASVNVFASFGTLANVNGALALRNAALFHTAKAIEVTRMTTIQAYFGAVAFAEQSNYLKELVSYLAESARRSNEAFKSEAISKREHTAISYLYKDIKIKSYESESMLKKNLRYLADLVGRKEIKEQDLVDDIRIERRPIPKATDVLNRYRTIDPELRAKSETIDSFEYRRRATLARDFPKVDIEGRYGDKGGYIGLGVSIPLFSGFSSFAQRRILAEQKSKAMLDRSKYESSVREYVNKLVDDMLIASNNIVNLTEAVKDANTIWKITNRSYRVSATEATDWESSLKRLLSAEMDMIRNLLVYRVSEASLRELETAKEN